HQPTSPLFPYTTLFRSTFDFTHAVTKWLGLQPHELAASERKALDRALERRTIAEDPVRRRDRELTLGERVSDRVARIGGSWTFRSEEHTSELQSQSNLV